MTDNKISNILFINFINKITYYQTYYHPEMWSNEKRDHVQSENFIPLLKNQNGEIVSYIYGSTNSITFMFPQMEVEDKIELLKALFNEILYKYHSEYFPSVEQKQWTKNALYYLPGHSELLAEDKRLDVKYKEDKSKVKRRIEDNYDKHSFT